MLTCKEEPLIWSSVTATPGSSKSKASILNHKKSSTLAGWSNLPGKSLLIDQLAKLKARTSGDKTSPLHASSGHLEDAQWQPNQRPSHEWLNIEKSVRFQLPEKPPCSMHHSKTATLPPLHRAYDVESIYPPIFFVPASLENDPRYGPANASIIVKSPMNSMGKSHSLNLGVASLGGPHSLAFESAKKPSSSHNDHHHMPRVHFKKTVTGNEGGGNTVSEKSHKSLSFFSWKKPSLKSNGVKKAKSISVLTEVVTDDSPFLPPIKTSKSAKGSRDRSPSKMPRASSSPRAPLLAKEPSPSDPIVIPITKKNVNPSEKLTLGPSQAKPSSLKSIVKATKTAVIDIHNKHVDAKKCAKSEAEAKDGSTPADSAVESDPGYESDPANKVLDDLASAPVEIPGDAVILPFPITLDLNPSATFLLLEQQNASASQTLRAALCKVEANHPGFAYDLVLGLVRKGDVAVNMNESLLRLQGTISEQENGEYRSSRTEEPFQELNKKSVALKKILSRIPDEITDRKTFLETIKEIASAIKKLLDAVNEVSAYIPGSNGKHALEQRKREFVKYSKRFSNTLKEYFKEGQPNSVFASATYLIYQTNHLMVTVKSKCE